MPRKYLVVTVGGACAPIVNAIKTERPDFVFFICSGGNVGSHKMVESPGTPCSEGKDGSPRPSIVTQTGLSQGQYKVMLVRNPDALSECYDACRNVHQEVKSRHAEADQEHEIVANYTGGTKTMSAALVLYAFQHRWQLKCNMGPRNDLVRVHMGDVPIRIDPSSVLVDWHRRIVDGMLDNYYFAEAADYLKRILSQEDIPLEMQQDWIACRNLCLGFNAWDCFQHEKALEVLESYARHCSEHFVFLKKILGQAGPRTHYERVEDLIYNAQRRVAQKRYDDAVARLYRAVELLAQIRLNLVHEIDTSDVDVSKIRDKTNVSSFPAEDGKIKIGLHLAYRLLEDLGDELGRLFAKRQKAIGNALSKRNASILAHGTTPIGEGTFREVENVLRDFLVQGLEAVGHPTTLNLQLPTTFGSLLTG